MMDTMVSQRKMYAVLMAAAGIQELSMSVIHQSTLGHGAGLQVHGSSAQHGAMVVHRPAQFHAKTQMAVSKHRTLMEFVAQTTSRLCSGIVLGMEQLRHARHAKLSVVQVDNAGILDRVMAPNS
jgi:hypothetical protein